MSDFNIEAEAFKILRDIRNWRVASSTSWWSVVGSHLFLHPEDSDSDVRSLIQEICAKIKIFKRRIEFKGYRECYPKISFQESGSGQVQKLITDHLAPEKSSDLIFTAEQVYFMLKHQTFMNFFNNAFFEHTERSKNSLSKKAVIQALEILLDLRKHTQGCPICYEGLNPLDLNLLSWAAACKHPVTCPKCSKDLIIVEGKLINPRSFKVYA